MVSNANDFSLLENGLLCVAIAVRWSLFDLVIFLLRIYEHKLKEKIVNIHFLKYLHFKKNEKSHNSKKRLGWTIDFAMLLSLFYYFETGSQVL